MTGVWTKPRMELLIAASTRRDSNTTSHNCRKVVAAEVAAQEDVSMAVRHHQLP